MITAFDYHQSNKSSPRPGSKMLSSLRKKIASLQLKNKNIFNEYKSNLKHGFERKIQTCRIQELMIRGQKKQKQKEQKQMKDKVILQGKRRYVRQQRLDRIGSRSYVIQTLQQRASRARSQALKQRQYTSQYFYHQQNLSLNLKQQKHIEMNKSRSQAKQNKQQRLIVSQMKLRQNYASQMKKQLQQIIQKQQLLDKLNEQLRILQQQKQQKDSFSRLKKQFSQKKTRQQNSHVIF